MIYRIAEEVESVQIACMVAHDEFREKFKPGLVEVVFEWAGGMVCPYSLFFFVSFCLYPSPSIFSSGASRLHVVSPSLSLFFLSRLVSLLSGEKQNAY